MELTINVEYMDDNGEYKDFDVEFTGYPKWENDSYSDEFGIVRMPEYAAMECTPTWVKANYTELQNEIIQTWLNDNERYVDKLFTKELEKDKFIY